MGKSLHIVNVIIILIFLISSVVLMNFNFLSSIDSSLVSLADIYLKSLFILSLVWLLLIILSFFKTKIENYSYNVSSIINIVLLIISILVFGSLFLAIFLSGSVDPNIVVVESYGVRAGFLIAILGEAPLFFHIFLFPLVFITSFIIFLRGYYKNKID